VPTATELLDRIGAYYAEKLAAHGATARGVDWNSNQSQTLRFEQFARLWGGATSFSLNDLGCGYGALYEFLAAREFAVDYLGIDVAPEMVEEATRRLGGRTRCAFVRGEVPTRLADYCVASGIFNVKLDASEATWREHILAVLAAMDATSRRGFAFNCVTRYSDAERMQGYLYYADPVFLFDYCKTRYARNVALLHDYGLYEFTLVVRKDIG
jgi:SAM-dependent methyltransferase